MLAPWQRCAIVISPQDELLELDVSERAIALLQAPAVLRVDEQVVGAFAEAVHADGLSLDASVPELVAQANADDAGSVEDFRRGDWGFSFTSNMLADALVRVSVPNDAGWRVTVDGRQVEPVDSVGMVLLPLTAGSHVVDARYQTPGVRIGAVVSTVSFGVFALAVVLARRGMGQGKR